MFKLFLFVAFLALASAAPGYLASGLTYSAYSAPSVYAAGIHPAPYAYSAYSAPLAYGYSPISSYGYKAPYYAL